MASCEQLQRTSMYFDGELAPADEREVADHIATCEPCQALLSDAVGLDALLSAVKPAAAVPIIARRRWRLAAAAAALIAAAAIAIIVLRPKPQAPRPDRVALVLPAKRMLEVRFTGEQLGKHRPYEAPVKRAHEPIDVRALADLEQRDQVRDLVGALASSGELVRAKELAAKSPADPAALSDLAAIALAGGDAESALDFAYQALDKNAELTAARWNLGLAARQLRYWRISRAAFAEVVARAEPGWSAEAKQHLALLDRELARGEAIAKLRAQFQLLVKAGSVRSVVLDPDLQRDAAEFQRVSRSILEDHTPIELADVRRYPSHALQFLYDSLASPTPDLIEGFEPVARMLDQVSGTKIATALLTKRTDPFAEIASWTGAALPPPCKNDVYAVPCVPLAWRLARAELTAGKLADADHTASTGLDLALREHIAVDYALLADLHRQAKRNALARADREEAQLGSR